MQLIFCVCFIACFHILVFFLSNAALRKKKKKVPFTFGTEGKKIAPNWCKKNKQLYYCPHFHVSYPHMW